MSAVGAPITQCLSQLELPLQPPSPTAAPHLACPPGELQTASSSPEPRLEMLPAGLVAAEVVTLQERSSAAASGGCAPCDAPTVELAYPKVRCLLQWHKAVCLMIALTQLLPAQPPGSHALALLCATAPLQIKKLEHTDMACSGGIRDRLLASLLPPGSPWRQQQQQLVAAASFEAAAEGPADDPLPAGIARRYGLMAWQDALRALHAPASVTEWAAARRRFAFQVCGGRHCGGPEHVSLSWLPA